ncbi:MAG: hypothetical protein ACJ75S_04020 [Solirubrobacterales bacterium]
MGVLIHVNFGTHDPLLTKKQLSQHPEIRRSTRWVEQRVAEGMPSQLDGNRRMFRLSEVRAWLADPGKPGSRAETVKEKEPAVADEAAVDDSAGPPLVVA